MSQAANMDALAAQPSDLPPESELPQLRTILLTDICDSTRLVEQLGDGGAAQFFREHDRLVLRLQNEWRGRLIDRSDGLLLLFERPIDGLGFAFDYARGLGEVGQLRDLDVKTRAGLHVGEVLIWRNTDESVRVGSKPVEVEGLAKPIAARLMSMARPGQILLSAVAEPLAHRAARELGERGQNMIWKSLGRWRFKGVPEPQEIFEVGEPGVAPLRAPPNSPKAWRDIPLWRRPAALAAQLGVLALIGFAFWFTTRPAPAIAFNERDWVVVADLRNLTTDQRYDNALEAALRITMEQSSHVNVIPDARVQDTLALMAHMSTGVTIDRSIGSEVAQRIGARALLLPSVADVGGRVRVTIEVVDPFTQATVFAESAEGRNADSAVRSVGQASDALRERLGEALSSIKKSAAPAEQVTTGSLDALRAFTLGQQAYALQELDEARHHFTQALSLDPGFAMARIGLARVEFSKTNVPAALEHMQAALKGQGRLTDRERLYAVAQLALIRWDRDFIDRWIALSKLYPDFHVAAFNTSMGMRYGNRFPELLDYSERSASAHAITRPAALHQAAVAKLAMGRTAEAERDFREAAALGSRMGVVDPVFNLAAMGRLDQAEEMLRSQEGGPPHVILERSMADLALTAIGGRWDEADRKARALNHSLQNPSMPYEWSGRALALSILQRTAKAGEVQREAVRLLNQASVALPSSVGRSQESVANAALYAGYVAAKRGDAATAEKALALAQPMIARAPQPVLANMAALVRARIRLHAGDVEGALEQLKPYQQQPWALLLTRVVLLDAQRAAGVASNGPDRTSKEWQGRAYAEWATERPPIIETLVSR
ncbi:MAG: putative peptide modification system cyclase [Pseudomonadota bacterium]|nr:putative peptide modification system cyclase [Pseudomonadota bacterium]